MNQVKKMYFSTQAQLTSFVNSITLDPNTVGYKITLEEFETANELNIEKKRLTQQLSQLQQDKSGEIAKVTNELSELNTNLP